MKPVAAVTFAILTAGLAVAQSPNGGWRGVGDPPPASTPAPTAQAGVDPTQPVDRSDPYAQGPVQAGPVDAAPPAGMAQQQNAPLYGIPQQLVVKQGTFVTVRINQGLSSNRNNLGDVFSGTLMQPLVVDGIVVAPRGQAVYGRVMEAKKGEHLGGVSRLGLQLTSVTLADGNQQQLPSLMVTRNGRSNRGAEVGTVATTTGVGAAIGAAADWGRGAAIGAGAGAAAGIIGVLLAHGQPVEVYPETVLTFETTQPVAISTMRAPQAFRYVDPSDYPQPVTVAQRPPRPAPRPVYGPPVYAAPYPYPYPYPYYAPYYYGPGFGFGVVVRGGGWRRW